MSTANKVIGIFLNFSSAILLAVSIISSMSFADVVPLAAADKIFSDFSKQTIPFSSQRFSGFQQGADEERKIVSKSGNLIAYVKLPANTRQAPMAILLHGCDGIEGNTVDGLKKWSDWFLSKGVGVVILDSFASRKVKATCGAPDGHWAKRRVDDVFSAIKYIKSKNLSPPGQILILGESNGGRTALNAASQDEFNRPETFAAAFALYPYCGDDKTTEFARPIEIFTAERDVKNKAELCMNLNRSGRKYASPKVVFLPKATHAYDIDKPLRVDRSNPMEFDSAAVQLTRTEIEAVLKSFSTQTRGLRVQFTTSD